MTLRPLLRRPGVIALAILLLLAGALTLVWLVAKARLLETLASEAAALRGQGWEVAFTVGDTDGFPLAVQTELTGVSLHRPGPRGDISWKTDRLAMAWSLLRPSATLIRLPTESEVRLTSGEKRLAGQLSLREGELVLIGPRAGGRLVLTADEPTLLLTAPYPATLRAERLSIDLKDLATRGRDHLVATIQGGIALERFTAPQLSLLLAEPLTASVGLTVMGDTPAAFTAPAFSEWRDGGGTVELRRLMLALGGFALEGEGTLTLDRLMRPLAAGTAKVRGFVEGIDRLIAVGLVTERDGRLARLLLSAVASTDAQTGQPTLSVPITVQDGWLLLGPSRLVPVAPLPLPELP
ncbi:hypothetical protein VZ95_01940 [Elstera litoralis]|uniref:DUF2125 domain-containing protein n=1 Tax=Elstera litoralis TaxID=552518 RepID=A0A0F3IVW5_9PROT|nr:DUF2125 domain-containing protein [Elstera litoralis]KJV10895.1 hypothetical protein VZ95_01940 [Elstera litoralis]